MSRSFNLPGGSAGSSNMGRRGPKTGFFQNGVRHAFASGDRDIKGRILPAFDTSMSREDKAFSRSWVPYRNLAADPSEYDEDTKSPPFSGWFQVFKGYRFFGKSSDSFISPLTLRGAVPDSESRCPVFDCFMKAKKAEPGSAWAALLKSDKGDKNDRGILPAPSVLAAVNMYMSSEKGDWENAVFTMPQASLIDLKTKLCVLTPRSMPEPYDPDFPDFLFGDITNPKTGLLVTGTKLTLATNNAIKYNGFRIGRSDQKLDGAAPKAVSDDILARRWELMSDKTLKILTYQEIVNLLLDDGALPVDLIQEACSEFADVNVSRTRGIPADEAEGGKGYPDSRKATAHHAAFSAPYGQDGEQFWGVVNGKTVKVMDGDIDEQIANGVDPSKIKLMRLDKVGGWQTAAALGFKAPTVEEDEPPPPPDEDDAPPPPDEDDAPPPPDDEPEAPKADSKAAYEKASSKAAGGLTAAEAQELESLSNLVRDGANLDADQLSRLVNLNMRKGGN